MATSKKSGSKKRSTGSKERDKPERGFTLTVPLDASAIKERRAGHRLKVVTQDADGNLNSGTVAVGENGSGNARLLFARKPGSLRVFVGPNDASDEEITRLQTL